MDCSPPGSSVRGIFQARTLEWVVISSSRGSSDPGIELESLVSPALAGRFFTTVLPEKPCVDISQCIDVGQRYNAKYCHFMWRVIYWKWILKGRYCLGIFAPEQLPRHSYLMAYLGWQILLSLVFDVLFFPHVLLCNWNPLGCALHHCCTVFPEPTLQEPSSSCLPATYKQEPKCGSFPSQHHSEGRVAEAEVIWKDMCQGWDLPSSVKNVWNLGTWHKVGVENIPASAARTRSRHSVSALGARK